MSLDTGRKIEMSEIGSIEELINELEFIETLEMQKLRAEIIALKKEGTPYVSKLIAYEDLAEKQGLLKEASGQIALMIMKLHINLESKFGNPKSDLMDIYDYISGAQCSYPDALVGVYSTVKRLAKL